jgi:adenylate cyclase
MGDGMLVLFGAPIWKPDHAERAVTCALAMQRGMDDVNRRSRTNGLPVIEMGIGIATGEVIVGNIGSLRRAKYGVVGTTVNLASRIEAYTVGGQILISDTTAAEAGRSLILGDSIRVEPKGAREPITLREVRGIDGRADLTLPPPPASPLPLHVRCTCNVVDDKFTTGPGFAGHIRPLSQREADLQCDVSLPPLTDLRIRFIDEAGVEMAGDVYAKVTGQPGPEHYRVRFTSVPPAARRFVAKRARSPKRADSRRVPQPAASGTDTALEHAPIDASDGVLKGERALA